MKNILKFALIAALLCVGLSSAVSAQKFGYVNSGEVIMSMSEYKDVETNIAKLEQEHYEQLDLIRVEFNTKYEEYNKNLATYSDAVRQMKEKELNDINSRFDEYRQIANEDLQKAEAEMMLPIYEKARNAINKVGVDNGFTIIFDLSTGSIAYLDEKTTVDVTPLVKKELGIAG